MSLSLFSVGHPLLGIRLIKNQLGTKLGLDLVFQENVFITAIPLWHHGVSFVSYNLSNIASSWIGSAGKCPASQLSTVVQLTSKPRRLN